MDDILSLKAVLFLAFQTDQNKHNGPSCQTALRFLATKDPLHPKRVSFTEEGNTQDTPNNERSNTHTSLVFLQWRRRWSIDSSYVWQKKHLFVKAQPLFWIWSKVRTFPHEASQAKNLILGCTQSHDWIVLCMLSFYFFHFPRKFKHFFLALYLFKNSVQHMQ